MAANDELMQQLLAGLDDERPARREQPKPAAKKPRPMVAAPPKGDAIDRYRDSATAAAVVTAAVVWVLMLVLNGWLTVQALAMFGVSAWAAWGIQGAASLMEAFLWRAGIRLLYPLILVIGVCDVLASAWGIQRWGAQYLEGAAYTLNGAIACTILAMVIALIPEPMLATIGRWLTRWRR